MRHTFGYVANRLKVNLSKSVIASLAMVCPVWMPCKVISNLLEIVSTITGDLDSTTETMNCDRETVQRKSIRDRINICEFADDFYVYDYEGAGTRARRKRRTSSIPMQMCPPLT